MVAQFAARIPLSGSSYQWASRLATPKVGWGFGWLSFCFLAVAVVAVDNAPASQAFMPFAGMEPDEDAARVITLVVLLVQTVLSIASTRIVSVINTAAVVIEVALVVVVSIALTVAVLVTGDGAADNLTSRGIAAHAPDYFAVGGGLTLAMITGLATLVGFDSAANLAEEAKDAHRTVPRAIVGSVVAAAALGMLFLIALTVAIKDVPRISAGGSPVAAIMRDQLGPVMERTLLVAITFAFFGAGIVTLTSYAPRLRDGARRALPGPSADATGQSADADPGPGDPPDLRPRGRPHGRDLHPGVDARRAVPAGLTERGLRLRRDRGRSPPGGRAVLPRHADGRLQGAGDRARRHG
ncbi:APC family permease [Streptomyces vinaceus]|uniref:APC family permease n=1 Tax=Streptomyces vinaceus TaxID=1960 RepID=UPI0036AC5BEF